MRSFGATALFMLAIVTECLSAQDRSRQRSGPIRSVPVAADIKKDVDFDCPEEFGYYPHPTDCRFYYVCVFGGALLESCTGGLMYSHELQTCDWPRNVGCDATGVVGGEDLERYSERDTPPPPPPPPRRTPPPPPPRAQPNPIITSRGQPKFNRNEYEKQQQLYAEVDDLPPVEEIETDRQQRVYRGQPSTIGQVQKDRDGYASQVISSGRTLNSNIIPASISQNSKIGSFSFGSQVDERRTATVTQAPQTYSGKVSENVTETLDRLIDLKTNEIPVTDVANKKHLRTKRQTTDKELGSTENKNITQDKISKRNDNDQEMEYVEVDAEILQDDYEDDINQDESERGKRQIRYYLKNGQKTPAKIWPNSKQLKYVNLQQLNYNPNIQSSRFQPIYSGDYNGAVRQQYPSESNYYSTANPFIVYQSQSQNPFKPSLPDPLKQKPAHNSLNTNTQVITKSPPISSLNNHDNPFAALAGGFYNNDQSQNNKQVASQFMSSLNRPSFVSFPDSAHHTSTIVTAKPIPVSTSPRKPFNYEVNPVKIQDTKDNIRHDQSNRNVKNQQKYASRPGYNDQNYDDEDEDSEEESSEEDLSENSNEKFKYNFPNPPHEYTHPRNKFANIENPFAKPDFDFDAFLDKLRNDHYAVIGITTPKPKNTYNAIKIINAPQEVTTASNLNPAGFRSSTQNYNGISTPRPFTMPNGISNTISPTQSSSSSTTKQFQQFQQQQKLQQSQPNPSNQQKFQQQHDAGTPLETLRPKLKPPNFKDDRQLPIIYNFNKPIEVGNQATSPTMKFQKETQQLYSVTQKPFYFVTATGSPVIYSTSKNQFVIRPNNVISLQPQFVSTMKPYVSSSVKPQNSFAAHTYSTSKPLTTLTNDQLSALQHYWRNPSTQVTLQPSLRQTTFSKLENLFVQTLRPTSQVQNNNYNAGNNFVSSTTKVPPTRKLIPKPSPEMSDYYYDEDDEQYYYEPPVKPKYMPSTEVKPQRPPMAQNYQEYEDSIEDSAVDNPSNIKYPRPAGRRPAKYSSLQPESVTKNLNDVSVVTKSPFKESSKAINGKLVSAMINYVTSTPSILKRPEVSNYDIIHHNSRNRTIHIRRPIRYENNPNTLRPPKYLNQTTLRPYTVRHRLAKPTTVKDGREDNKQTKGIMRHPNIVAQMKFTTPRDSYKQETRYTKTKHDDRTNSLEPTESVTPASYSASPRPKMLYNGSQNYSPDQYDPYYAVYDEDGELYKDTDYVQQYNTASLRPAVQQTYRGTPPPARRPVETYTPRPVSPDDYDDALIQGQISNQNQYQSPVRQPSRGEGNELGYEHHLPSSARTTVYEATTLRTTPSTTSTSTTTTTQRPTTALFTEAMTPSRHTSRSSSDENPLRNPESPSKQNILDSTSSPSPTLSAIINVSSLAKPFEKTDNSHRLADTLPTTERLPTRRHPSRVTNNSNNIPVEVVQAPSNTDNNKKVVSLTTGFSIRRNLNNTKNPYTLTVITRPFDTSDKSTSGNSPTSNNNENVQQLTDRYYYNTNSKSDDQFLEPKTDKYNIKEAAPSISTRRKDAFPEVIEEEEPVAYNRPSIRQSSTVRPRFRISTLPSTTGTTKYYIKTVIKRPTPFSLNNENNEDSTENGINTEAIIENGLRNAKRPFSPPEPQPVEAKIENSPPWQQSEHPVESEPIVSPYRTLNNLRNINNEQDLVLDYSTSTTSTTRFTTTTPKQVSEKTARTENYSQRKPSYYSYRVVDEVVPDQTTEVFSGKVKNIIKSFFNNLSSSPNYYEFSSSSPKPTPKPEEKIVNIGFQKKKVKYSEEKPVRNNVKRIQIITEPTINKFVSSSVDTIRFGEDYDKISKDYSSTTSSVAPSLTDAPIVIVGPETTPVMLESSSINEYSKTKQEKSYESKYTPLLSEDDGEKSRKFHKILNEEDAPQNKYRDKLVKELTKLTITSTENVHPSTTTERFRPLNIIVDDIASTTSTTKSTTTVKATLTSTTKSLSFPTRASRVNPAIKLAATNPGGGRRSYQSSSNCSSDNSLQANPKCNEIKYQRPTSTRGRGSAHYSTSSVSETPQQAAPNRGTPPTRSRPTLKPSTAIVSKTTEFVDIYAYPPKRPSPVYPQPTPDKTAAKCRKDVCLLPDCYCGGKDIPGDLPVETVPQIVLLTFDDSVNDLNKVLYSDLFDKGRVNPNGCPISATFYVSHEWTDYSQVQNLYSAGHEMASHTISHSFGEQFSQKKWNREVGGQREILAAYGGVKLEDVRGMRAPFLSVGGNKMFKMLYDSNFTYDSSLPVYENRPPSWPYTLDYKLFHDCMIPPCPTKSYPGVWEVPMVMWQDLNGGRCSMGDACANPPEAEGVYKMLLKNFDRHYTTNRAPFGLFYHAAWFTQPHHKEGFIMFLDFINKMKDVWIVTNWQALQWVRDPTPISRLNNFQPFQCNYQDRPKKCNNPKVCNLWHKSGVRYMRTCQPCPEIYPWTGKSGIRSSKIDNDIGE
ncbi:uncharacterized protein Cda5 isoform X1 [Epargyreus clarus]|uniref:uncharacterized protein Cda5 isoform X1 n=1 Tax=Epargyreus clarus TaxID=520877 RepID=UPI003C2C3E2B